MRKITRVAIAPLYINVEVQLSLRLAPVRKVIYQPRGINAVRLLFKKHFQSFPDRRHQVHHRYFTEEANRIGTKFTDDSIIICEQFKLIYT